jgi:hypothetical protein
MLLPSAVTMFVTGMFAGRLAVRLGGKTLVTGGCLIGGRPWPSSPRRPEWPAA